tara:strand:- start:124 stop:399 length:276 start_codon:yes stop_codon:yes gene_type:complete
VALVLLPKIDEDEDEMTMDEWYDEQRTTRVRNMMAFDEIKKDLNRMEDILDDDDDAISDSKKEDDSLYSIEDLNDLEEGWKTQESHAKSFL